MPLFFINLEMFFWKELLIFKFNLFINVHSSTRNRITYVKWTQQKKITKKIVIITIYWRIFKFLNKISSLHFRWVVLIEQEGKKRKTHNIDTDIFYSYFKKWTAYLQLKKPCFQSFFKHHLFIVLICFYNSCVHFTIE